MVRTAHSDESIVKSRNRVSRGGDFDPPRARDRVHLLTLRCGSRAEHGATRGQRRVRSRVGASHRVIETIEVAVASDARS
jgi:hypothetical protein